MVGADDNGMMKACRKLTEQVIDDGIQFTVLRAHKTGVYTVQKPWCLASGLKFHFLLSPHSGFGAHYELRGTSSTLTEAGWPAPGNL